MDNNFISTTNIDSSEFWQAFLDEVSKVVAAISFDVWILTLGFVEFKGNTLVVSTPTQSSKQTILKNYKKQIIASANKVYRMITDLEVVVKEDEPTVEEKNETPQAEKERVYSGNEEFDDGFKFNPKYTFDNFIVGGSNQFAAAAAKAVADEPSSKINPLFIYGGSGLGKTHLLHAIGNHIHEKYPKLNVVYVTTDKFITDFMTALQKNSTDKFRAVYSKADVFIIDDIQHLIKKVQTQEQFFNIFNELHQKGKQIVITCDKQPKELNPLEERLRSRFEWGMLADIGVPDIETRIAILNKKAQIERYNVSKEVIEYIAEVATSNVREMEGFLSRTVFWSNLRGEKIVSIETARDALKDIAKTDDETIDATKIIEIVCKFYAIKKEEMLARKRTKNVAEARQVAMYLITEYLSLPLEAVGNIFGKDHATVIYAKNKIADDIKKSKKLEVQVNDIRQMIEGK